MPELPEVETIARDLSSVLLGQKVRKAEFLNSSVMENGGYLSANVLENKRLMAIGRRGKNLLFYFSENLAMVIHLKMTGRLILDKLGPDSDKHLHFHIQFENHRLYFYDVRKFGRIGIFEKQALKNHPRLSKLGPEPFAIDASEFARIIKNRNKAVKLILLDQQVVAGIGNIYADESLFDAGIRPDARPPRISVKRLKRLHKSVVKVLKKAISSRGSSVDDYLDGFGKSGQFQKLIKVYGRHGEDCPKCGTLLKRIVLGGRSSHYCPKCQH